jgi:hypothetical protein
MEPAVGVKKTGFSYRDYQTWDKDQRWEIFRGGSVPDDSRTSLETPGNQCTRKKTVSLLVCWRDWSSSWGRSLRIINSLIIVFKRGVLFISRPLRSSSQRAQRKTNLFFEKSLRRRFFKRTHASGGVLFAEREIFFDCRLPKVSTRAGSAAINNYLFSAISVCSVRDRLLSLFVTGRR